MIHEVRIACTCGDVERCKTELYVSDVRIAIAEIRRLERAIAAVWAASKRVLAA